MTPKSVWTDVHEGLGVIRGGLMCGEWRKGAVIPVVTDHSDADQSAAANHHGDEEGEPVRASLCKQNRPQRLAHAHIHLKNTRLLRGGRVSPWVAWGGRVGCRSLLQKSVLQHSMVLLVWAFGESCQSNRAKSKSYLCNIRKFFSVLVDFFNYDLKLKGFMGHRRFEH